MMCAYSAVRLQLMQHDCWCEATAHGQARRRELLKGGRATAASTYTPTCHALWRRWCESQVEVQRNHDACAPGLGGVRSRV